MKLRFKLNDQPIAIEASGAERLIDILRERLNLVGAKEGCGKGECGACTVLLDGDPVCSCLILAAQVAGRVVLTIEGLRGMPRFAPIMKAFEETGAVQCGFCSPGMVLSAAALLMKIKTPSHEQVRRALSGNLCRCTGYKKIAEAVEMAQITIGKK